MDYKIQIEKIYDHLENDEIHKAVMGCLRISRNLNDHLYTAIFLRELYPSKEEFARVLLDDTNDLKKEAYEFFDEISLSRWLEIHTLETIETENGEKKNVLGISVGEIKSQIEYLSGQIEDRCIPTSMGEFDTAYFTDKYNTEKKYLRTQVRLIQTVNERIKTRCLNYIVTIEKQLLGQEKSENFLQASYNTVNNYFKTYSDDVYNKLQKAAQLISSKNSEDYSLLLTEIRRALKAVADHFYPPKDGATQCVDGEIRNLGEENYLNRLQEFLMENIPKSSSRDLVKSEFDYLSVFSRKLNDIASKGVHSAVIYEEAKQGLIGLYLFLYNLINIIQKKT